MTKKLLCSCFIILFSLISTRIFAQESYSFGEGWKMSGYLGSSSFSGDVKDKVSFVENSPFGKYFYKNRKFGGGIYIDKMIVPAFGLRGNLTYSDMMGTKESENIYFTGSFFEYSLSAYVDIATFFSGYEKNRKFNPYAFAGIGLCSIQSQLFDLKTNEVIAEQGYKEFPNGTYNRLTEKVFPIGIGAKYKINDKIDIFLELTKHIATTNKMDSYPKKGTNFESLNLINVGVTYSFSEMLTYKYNGKSSDASISHFNKNKRVVMNTKASKKALKKRKKYMRKNKW